ncbi:LacI family DNA-binding transcriptional regulator [Amycolatopsis jejuensis]|uniref:LacI family DNA-binding transcriptional regulator n=1 Tax=Amycolatopsis jejuensis TaxID=330084 RepID=UPI000526F6EE|nr:LacI family DNA-binding transcriptional regulator [Amycolatopsis jejuensis]
MPRVTINDVAAESNVSRATVSLVLRGSTKISEPTKQRVLDTMVRLGYVYNRQAANLRTQRTMTVGLVLTGVRDPWYADVTMAVEEHAHRAGCTLLTGYSRDMLDRQDKLLSAMVEQRVDGVVLLPATETPADSLARSLSAIPHVLIDRRVPGLTADCVLVDHENAARQVAEHLAGLGVRSVAFLGGLPGCTVRAAREAGLRAPGLTLRPDWSIATDGEHAGGTRAAEELLDLGALPDAIVAYSDVVALGVVSALRRRGIEPGRGVALASFDDISEAALQPTPLTSAATFPERQGELAVDLLLERIAQPSDKPREVVYPSELRVRESTSDWAGRRSGR